MAIDFTGVATTDLYATGFVPKINEATKALSMLLDPAYATYTGTPFTGAKRLNGGLFEQFNGSSWAALSMGYAKRAGDTLSGLMTSTATEALRVTAAGALLSGWNAAGTLRTGYIEWLAGTTVTYGAENGALPVWKVGGTEQMRMDATGNLGLGVTAPAVRLDVAGSARVRGGGQAQLFNADNTAWCYWSNPGPTGAGNGVMALNQGGVGELLRIDASGRLLLGYTANALSAALQVNGAAGFPTTTSTLSGVFGASTAADAFTVDTNKLLHNYGLSWKTFSDAGSAPSAALSGYAGVRFFTGSAERVRIDSAGNVGVGVAAPSVLLDIGGAAQVRGANQVAWLSGDNSSSYAFKNVGAAGAGNAVLALVQNAAGERLRIDAAGNLGLGRTSPSRKLDIAGGAMTTAVAVAFSATPTFDAAASNLSIFGNLTGNVTAMTISNAAEGQFLSIRMRQDATGGRTVALPAGASVAGSINLSANKTSYLNLTWNATDARWEGNWSQIP